MDDKQIKKVSVIFFLICSCFLIVGCSEEKPELQEEAVVSTEDKNKEAVRAVLESEFTVPNEEYILIQKNIEKKEAEIQQSLPAGSGFGIPEDSPEWLAYEGLVEKSYKPYFMDYMYEQLIPSNQAFQFHLSTELDDVRYKMKVLDIQVTKSENNNTPKFYDFRAHVEYTSIAGEVSQHEIIGMAILSEEGKIGKFEIRDIGGLQEKIEVDKGY